MLLQWLCCTGLLSQFAWVDWQLCLYVCICLHDRLGKRELARVESVDLALCVSKPSVAVCRRKHNNKLLNIWTTIPFLWFSVPPCIRFCVLAHFISDVFASPALSTVSRSPELLLRCRCSWYGGNEWCAWYLRDLPPCYVIFCCSCFFSRASMPICYTWVLVHTCLSLS